MSTTTTTTVAAAAGNGEKKKKMKRKKNIASNSLSIQQTRNCHFIFYICSSVSSSSSSPPLFVPLFVPLFPSRSPAFSVALSFFPSVFRFSIFMSNADDICCTFYTNDAIYIFGPFFSFRFCFFFYFFSVCLPEIRSHIILYFFLARSVLLPLYRIQFYGIAVDPMMNSLLSILFFFSLHLYSFFYFVSAVYRIESI